MNFTDVELQWLLSVAVDCAEDVRDDMNVHDTVYGWCEEALEVCATNDQEYESQPAFTILKKLDPDHPYVCE